MPGRDSAPTVSVVIPTLNEALNLPHVLPRLPAMVTEVVIVDGDSTDGTIDVALALRPDARIVRQVGRGKGSALRSSTPTDRPIPTRSSSSLRRS
jgi:glycosyltransferase involved in cell wall biosynthesis